MGRLIERPQSLPLRRFLYQVHLWVGVAAGLYVLVACLSGAALMFRIDLQRASYPQLLVARSAGPTAGAATILQSLAERYPHAQIAGIDAPTTLRATYLAYVLDAGSFRTVLLDPSTAEVLGELPEQSAIRLLQDLHFNLLAGKPGRAINGIGALCLLILCLTGIVIWWRGRARWKSGFGVRRNAGWPQLVRDLHSAAGIWSVLLIGMWSITALSFTFPKQFRAALNTVSTISSVTAPGSDVTRKQPGAAPTWDVMIERARQAAPGRHVARVIAPSGADKTFQVLFADRQPTPAGTLSLVSVHLDQYSGELLSVRERGTRSFADAVLEWAAPLHVGNFGVPGVRFVWFVLGLAPPLLFATGAITWWRRVVRPARQHELARNG